MLARGVSAFLATVEGRAGRTTCIRSIAGWRCAARCPRMTSARRARRRLGHRAHHPLPGCAARRHGRVERRLDPDRPLELASESAIARYSLPIEFSGESLREAEANGARNDQREARGRVDLRSMPLVTIDGEDARDFDDAVYRRAARQGLSPGRRDRRRQPLRAARHRSMREARARGTSVYFPQPRAADAADGALGPPVLARARSRPPVHGRGHAGLGHRPARRFEVLSGGDAQPCAAHLHPRARGAVRGAAGSAPRSLGRCCSDSSRWSIVYQALLKARNRRGALDFDSAEAGFEFDAEQRVRQVGFHPRNDAHRLIEECMILANVAVARELKAARMPARCSACTAVPEQKQARRCCSGLAGARHCRRAARGP